MNLDDLIVWPDGYQCLRSELSEYRWKSDDYEIVPYGSERWQTLMEGED